MSLRCQIKQLSDKVCRVIFIGRTPVSYTHLEVCAQSLNMLCGSGLKAVMEATMRIQCGFGDIFVAGGVESMTNAPYLVPSKVRNGVKMGDMKMVDSMLHDLSLIHI